MKAVDTSNVNEASAEGFGGGLPAGGYVCTIKTVEDKEDKEYLYIEFEISEGEYKDYYKGLEERAGFWGGTLRRSYKEKALPMFKRMCSAVSKSNPGFVFDGGKINADESTLVGKKIGLIMQEEEYEKNNGTIGTRITVSAEVPIDKIRTGDFKVPEKKFLKKLSNNANAATGNNFVNVQPGDEDTVPFN